MTLILEVVVVGCSAAVVAIATRAFRVAPPIGAGEGALPVADTVVIGAGPNTAHAWARSESASTACIGVESADGGVPAVAEPPASEVRERARSVGLPVAGQGRRRAEIVQARSDAPRP